MSIEAMQQALNALEYHTMQTRPIHHTDKAIEALRQAIEQAEKQEPVAWVTFVESFGGYPKLKASETQKEGYVPVFTAPPRKEWVGLTDEERRHFNNRLSGSGVAEDIEAALRSKNT